MAPDLNVGPAPRTTARETGGRTDRATRPPAARVGALWHTAGPFAVFAVLLLVTGILNPGFLSGGLVILAIQATAILLVALGQAAVLHVGSIDLSNAATAILSAMILATALGTTGPAAVVVCLVVATVVGVVNGVLVAYAQVPSFALTLGTLGILQAASLVLSGSTTVYVTANGELVSWLFVVTFAGLPAGFWVAALLAVLGWFVLQRTGLGQGLTAVGRNETGALFSGLRARRLKVVAFAASGFLAGVAGIAIIAQAGAASSFGLGSDLLLPGIAAAIVGGTAITGGHTNPINVIFGSLTIALIPITATALGVTPQARSLVYGIVVVAAVALTTRRVRGASVF
ncbi:ABC transporter permease [Kineococcus gynurae]|uniref:ABC transporter permease n=1 Tax=Kineococcus gynurae TaxID=452979 RepID=A0ABV5LPA5_9ACTN